MRHGHRRIAEPSDTPLRDILLPHSDRVALIEIVVVLIATGAATYLVRRERALALLVIGVGATLLGLMTLRAPH